MFENWLRQTRELQIKHYGTDPNLLKGDQLANYVSWNVTALVVELGEMMREFPSWKPWVIRRGEVLNHDKFIEEAVDILHFLGNILCAARCSDEELSIVYIAKMEENKRRTSDPLYDGLHRSHSESIPSDDLN